MLRRCGVLFIAALLIPTNTTVSLCAQRAARGDERAADKVMKSIIKLGVGPEARVRVELRDGTRLVGYVSEAGPDTFTVTDLTSGKTTRIEYTQVKRVVGSNSRTGVVVGRAGGKSGSILSKAIPMAAGIAIVVVVVVSVLRRGDL
ncbi:MAG: hypothetical protein M3362_05595 [Acidobacteriota bacterium]|nr:hypothetical protein [Acidobacteriota bacterium]